MGGVPAKAVGLSGRRSSLQSLTQYRNTKRYPRGPAPGRAGPSG